MAHAPSARTTLLVGLGLLGLALSGFVFWQMNRKLAPPPDSPKKSGFVECARESGIDFQMAFLPGEQGENFKINLYDHGSGVAVADYDGDGHEDIYLVNQLGANGLYRNKGDGTFENVTRKAGVGLGDRVCVAAVFADYDNDGHQDLFVTSTRGGNVLFHNNGEGTFTEVTKKAGVEQVGHAQTAVFFDYDNDGFLDLFVTYTAQWTLNRKDDSSRYYPGPVTLWELANSPREYNMLYHNNGDGTFTNVTEKAGVQGKGWGGDVAVFDYNDDGYLDLFVTNMFGASQLFRNNKDGTFTNVTTNILGRTSFGAIGSKAFDFNNDGKLDLIIADMHSDMWLPFEFNPADFPRDALHMKYKTTQGMGYDRAPNGKELEQRFLDTLRFKHDEVLFGNTLYKKLPSGKFEEVSDKANLETWWPWGVATGDFDNDGYEDVFIPTGMGYPYAYWPNVLMMNNGNETFTDRAAELGIEPPPDGRYLPNPIGGKQAARSSRCAAVADFDGDGRLDLIVNNFNDRAFYFHNQFPARNYLSFQLTGTKCNRDAIGALVRIFMGKEVMVRQVHAAGGYLSQSSKIVHFGLGDRSRVDRVEIHWPGWPADKYETITNPTLNTLHRRTEPSR